MKLIRLILIIITATYHFYDNFTPVNISRQLTWMVESVKISLTFCQQEKQKNCVNKKEKNEEEKN